MKITADPTFSYIMHDYGGGNVTYAHSAPRLGINPPVQEYWIAKANDEEPLHFGGVVYATKPRAPATKGRET
jgi:hypothetical protein